MTFIRQNSLAAALAAALVLAAAPARASQDTLELWTTGPHSMADVAGRLNLSHQALATCNSGTSAPANGISGGTLAGWCWLDTTATPYVWKMLDAPSGTWVTIGSLNASAHTFNIAIAQGGTGAATASAARTNLGLGTAAVQNTGTSGTNVPLLDGNNVWSGSATFSGLAAIGSTAAFTGDITPSQVTSNQNDYNPAGLSTAGVVRLSTDASRDITGLQGGSDGRLLYVYNVGSFNAVLKNESASSSAANRFAFGADLTLGPNQTASLIYDSTASRWRASGNAALGAGVSGVTAGDGLSTGGVGATGGTISTTGTLTRVRPVNAQTGTSYTVVAGDNSKLVTFANAAAVAVTLPQATSTFGAGWSACFKNKGAGAVTITPTTSTIDGNASLGLDTAESFCVTSDGGNWETDRGNVNIGEVKLVAYNRTPPNFLPADGGSLSRSAPNDKLFAKLVASATVTISNASPAVVTWNGHGLSVCDNVKFFTSGSLPTGLTAGTHGLVTTGTSYYVQAAGYGANSFRVSTSCGGADVNTSSAGSGTHTAVNAPCGDGDGSTTYTVCDYRGEFLRGNDAVAGTARGVDVRGFGVPQSDAFQGHQHANSQASPGGASFQSGAGAFLSETVNTGNPVSDGTNGTPRTAAETRPRNVSVRAVIRYQ